MVNTTLLAVINPQELVACRFVKGGVDRFIYHNFLKALFEKYEGSAKLLLLVDNLSSHKSKLAKRLASNYKHIIIFHFYHLVTKINFFYFFYTFTSSPFFILHSSSHIYTHLSPFLFHLSRKFRFSKLIRFWLPFFFLVTFLFLNSNHPNVYVQPLFGPFCP